MDLIEPPGETAGVTVDRPAREPGHARPSVPRDHPVVERETHRREPLVVEGDRWQPLQRVTEVVPEEPDEAADERRRVRLVGQ